MREKFWNEESLFAHLFKEWVDGSLRIQAAHAVQFALDGVNSSHGRVCSPIERLLGMALVFGLRSHNDGRLVCFCEHEVPLNEIGDFFRRSNEDEVLVFPQCRVSVNDRSYRADYVVGYQSCHSKTVYSLAIECDGAEYHAATKEQVARDKRRDRDFHEIGLTTLRFTGAEIVRSPKACVEQIRRVVDRFADHAWETCQIRRDLVANGIDA